MKLQTTYSYVASDENIEKIRSTLLVSRKKLLVLDLNGLLADIVNSKQLTWTELMKGKEIQVMLVFKRPFCEDFEVGIWSSGTK
ncbi:unnamed protein product [Thlaspi arvense]|uniref:FCP1 homology domain-containing protein n=1 Tax=Thlaspi arvense TaxID=13288 RepID=A0AAU9SGI8_THLAR|nr:unnamed protein product [Thlaspi arvense]